MASTIRTLTDYQGITGTYNFNKNGDPALRKYFVFKVVSLDPAQWAQTAPVATFEIPPPN